MPIAPEPKRGKDGNLLGYRYRIDAGINPRTNKRERPYINGDTEAECRRKVIDALDQLNKGTYFTISSDLRAKAYFTDWLADQKRRLGASHYRSNASAMKSTIIPFFQELRLTAITTAEVNRWLTWLEFERPRPLKPATIRKHREVLNRAMKAALEDDLILKNPVPRSRPPKGKSTPGILLSIAEVEAVMTQARGHRFEPYWSLGFTTGMRQGELLGLLWPDVHLDEPKPYVYVRHQWLYEPGKGFCLSEPKGKRPRRIPVPDWIVPYLREVRDQQDAKRFGNRQWNERRHVVINLRGNPASPDDVTEETHRMAELAGGPDFTSHDMRHTYASRLIANGEPPNVVADLLGHADNGVLALRIYAHLFDEQRMQTAVAIPDFLNVRSTLEVLA